MRFASLGSGSEGNGLLVECGDAQAPLRLLVDCGFGVRDGARRLERLGLRPSDLDAVLVTHEHSDHLRGVGRLAAAHQLPVYATAGTARTGLDVVADRIDLRVIEPDRGFRFGDVLIHPVPVPHDSREPVQFVIDDGQRRLGVLTDLGHPTAHVVRTMARLDAIVLECNHDEELLRAGRYPPQLKRRIAGDYGHLANRAAAQILASIAHSGLGVVVAAHLSRENNRPELARAELARAWGRAPDDVIVADQDEGLDWVEVRAA